MMQTWFESQAKYMKVTENGSEKMVTEHFLLDAVSFTDGESRMIKQIQSMVKGGEFTVKVLKQSKIAEVFPFEDGEWWFKASVNLVTIDEEAGKEKKITTYYLVQADDIKQALIRLEESLDYLIIPYVVSKMEVTKILDVFPYDPAESVEELQKKEK
jgi:hypothetical protein